jgi:hypothetical protein
MRHRTVFRLCKDKGGPEGVDAPNPALDQHTYQTGRASRA